MDVCSILLRAYATDNEPMNSAPALTITPGLTLVAKSGDTAYVVIRKSSDPRGQRWMIQVSTRHYTIHGDEQWMANAQLVSFRTSEIRTRVNNGTWIIA